MNFYFFYVLSAIYGVNSDGIFRNLYGDDNISTRSVISVRHNVTSIECGADCVHDMTCDGFNLRGLWGGNMELGSCELIQGTSRPSMDVVSEGNSRYYERIDTRFCADQTLCHVYGEDLTFDEALTICPLINPLTHLADVRGPEESAGLSLVSWSLGDAVYWIAGRRPPGGGDDDFNWVVGDLGPVTYSEWFVTQPNGPPGTEDCMQAVPNWVGLWGDADCSERRRYFCQY